MARWTYANVLSVEADARRVWQFSPGAEKFTLNKEFTARNGQPIPGSLAGKDWHSLWQPKLNIAWLPADKIFLRVLQLPVAEFSETVSMIEFQIEKLSPLPVAQIVWTIEVLPQVENNLQSVIVIVVPRALVEEFLGQLEGHGYQPDRIETPLLDELLATPIKEDGVWIYPGETSASPVLVAWWYGGILRNLSLLSGSSTDAQQLKEQLAQMAWSGELEGWLNSPPQWHLVASPEAATAWEPILNDIAGETVHVVPALPKPELAALSARRAAKANAAAASLLPAEYSTRYRQQFIDRLWMRGAFAVFAIYCIGLVMYAGALVVLKFQLNQVQIKVAGISQEYTNTVQLAERVRILQEQKNLKSAALDSWKLISDNLPEGLTLSRLNFKQGKTLTISGTVTPENQMKLTEYYEIMSKANLNGIPLTAGPLTTPAPSPGPGGTMVIRWSFVCQIGAKE